MYLQECLSCQHGDRKDEKSYCEREAVYSYLTNCIKKKAIDYYLEQNGQSDVPLEMVGNQ